MVGPLEGANRDPRAPTTNIKNIGGRPEAPLGGSGLHPGSERSVVNLHGHDRQKVILLMGPTSQRLVLLWLTTLSWIMGHT
jgi:hypothetical protein